MARKEGYATRFCFLQDTSNFGLVNSTKLHAHRNSLRYAKTRFGNYDD